MDKKILAIIAAVVVIGAGAFVLTQNKDDDTNNTNNTPASSQSASSGEFSPKTIKACEVLTKAVAEEVAGNTVEDNNSQIPTSANPDIDLTICSYLETTEASGQAILNARSVGLLARSAKTEGGRDSNKVVFDGGGQKPAEAQDVNGYGDAAFWNPAAGQLNVLKNGNWYILTNSKGSNPANATLDEAKKLADAIIDEL